MNEKTKWMFMYGKSDSRRIGCRYNQLPDQDCLNQKEEEVDCTICSRCVQLKALCWERWRCEYIGYS